MCVSHRRHVTSHLKRRGDSQSRTDTHTHTHTHRALSVELKQGSGMCLCYCAWDRLGKIQHPPTSQIISHRAKKPCEASPPHSIVFANRNRARQNGSTGLSFCTVTACCRLLDSIKTSQTHVHSYSMYLLQWKTYTAVLTQMYTESK